MRRYFLVFGTAALSGLLLTLALPPAGFSWLAPICLVPVLSAVLGGGFLRGFLGGIVTPLIAAIIAGSRLIYHVPGEGEGIAWVFVGFGFFGFTIAIVCSIAGELKVTGWRRILVLSSLAVGLEYLLFPVLPAHLGLTQYRVPGMLFLASVGGLWMVSWLVWAANLAIAESVVSKNNRSGLVAAIAFAAMSVCPNSRKSGGTVVAALQTQSVDLEPLAKLNAEAGKKGAEIAVWPEFSGLAIANAGDTSELRKLSSQPGQPAFVTTFRDDFQPIPHNAAALFYRGQESKRYFKRKRFGSEDKMHAEGTEPVVVAWPAHASVGLNICYDSCYTGIIRETAALGDAGLVALPTIDPDATNCFIAAAHSAFTPFRAAESGLAMVRADGIAYSQIVDNAGNIVAEMGPRQEGVLVGEIELKKRWTLYSVLGDWFLYLCGIYVSFEIGRGLFHRRER